MKFPAYFLDQLRQVLPPSRVVRRRVRLQAKSGGEYVGLCPFHNEKTPSFTVSDNKGFYHCFGCGAHGDIVKFLMETSGLSFADSVKELAAEAGLALPVITPEAREKEKKISDIYEIMEMACRFFEEQLASGAGFHAREYLAKRELSAEQVKKFRLGFAPDGSGLKNYFKAKGVAEELLEGAGLIGRGERGETYDRFRARLIFPITDERGKVIAFGGRALGDQMPKYLNSPETDIFKKGHNLYNLSSAQMPARKTNRIVVVEGYMDVIAMDKAGIANSVAPLGTALTEQQLQKLWNLVNEPTICLDGDSAGKRAMAKIAENYLPLLTPGNSLSFVILPPGLDPDDAIKAKGADYMRKAIERALPLSEAVWNIELGGEPPQTPERIAALESRLSALSGRIQDKAVKSYYARFFKTKLFEYGRNQQSSGKKKAKPQPIKRTSAVEELNRSEVSPPHLTELLLLKYVLDCPKILEDSVIEEEFAHLEFKHPALDKARVAILEHTALNLMGSDENLQEYLEKKGINLHIFYGKGKNGAGISLRPGMELEEAKAGWGFSVARHNLLKIKELIEKETDAARQHEYQRQAKVLESIFAAEKTSFETILKIEE